MGHKITQFSSEIEAIVRDAESRIQGATFRRNKQNTPHLVVKLPNWKYEYSVVYFSTSKTWRVFYPYIEDVICKQRKKNLSSLNELIEFFNELRDRKNTDLK
jgi:hypothetical protein